MRKTRNIFGIIFLLTGLGIFYILASNSIATELHDVLHGPPLTEPARKAMPAWANQTLNKVLPERVDQLPHIKLLSSQSTNENPFQQFNVIRWMGWAFVIVAFADVATAYLSRTKQRVEE